MASRSSSSFPGFSKLFLLEEPGNGRAFRGRLSLSGEESLAQTRAEKLDSVKLDWAMGGREPSDIIRVTTAFPIIVSQRIHDLFVAEGFVGWKRYPVEVFGKDGARFDGYHGLAVDGRCGAIDVSRSLPFEKAMPGGKFTWFRGLYFEPSTWDGSDIFMSVDTVGWIFVVERVKKVLKDSKVGNLLFTPLDEVERMTR